MNDISLWQTSRFDSLMNRLVWRPDGFRKWKLAVDSTKPPRSRKIAVTPRRTISSSAMPLRTSPFVTSTRTVSLPRTSKPSTVTAARGPTRSRIRRKSRDVAISAASRFASGARATKINSSGLRLASTSRSTGSPIVNPSSPSMPTNATRTSTGTSSTTFSKRLRKIGFMLRERAEAAA